MVNSFYAFKARSIQGAELEMSRFSGKIILVVNTASECGFTLQFAGLEDLYRKYRDQGLMILGFPCNQFGRQEPGSEKDIMKGCLVDFGVTFPVFSKIYVNGRKTHPIFQFLKQKLPGTFGKRVKWNFTKFLIGKNGIPLKRFAPAVPPEKIEKDILDLLASD
jgi:glutathione peroxidase